MAKKKPHPPIDLSFGSDLDDVYNQLNPAENSPPPPPPVSPSTTPQHDRNATDVNEEENVEPPPPPPPSTESTPPPAAHRSAKRKTKESKKNTRSRRSRESRSTAAAATDAPVEPMPAPPSTFSSEQVAWFFSNSAPAPEPKQIYVTKSVKETLHHVARATGLPAGHLADNIIRWFLLSNKQDITKLMSRKRNPLDQLDL